MNTLKLKWLSHGPVGGQLDNACKALEIFRAWRVLWQEYDEKGILGDQECECEIPESLLEALGDKGVERIVYWLNILFSGYSSPAERAFFDRDARIIRISWTQ